MDVERGRHPRKKEDGIIGTPGRIGQRRQEDERAEERERHKEGPRWKEQCPICMEMVGEVNQAVQTECKHWFCTFKCAQEWTARSSKCPVCMKEMGSISMAVEQKAFASINDEDDDFAMALRLAEGVEDY